MVDPGGKCRPLCTHEHWETSTQRLPSKTFPTAKQHCHNNIEEGDGQTKSRRGRFVGTRTGAAVHTLLLADLLDVEAVAGCRARLGAFAVLHPDWTLGDWEAQREPSSRQPHEDASALASGGSYSTGSPPAIHGEGSRVRGRCGRTPAGWGSSSLHRPAGRSDTPPPDRVPGTPLETPGAHSAGRQWRSGANCSWTRSTTQAFCVMFIKITIGWFGTQLRKKANFFFYLSQ